MLGNINELGNIPSVKIEVSEVPAQAAEYDDEKIKFSNITAKTPYATVRNFTVIDVETTGLSPRKDEILEICAIKFRDGLPTEKFSTLTSPHKKIPPEATKVNGISQNMVEGFPHFSLIADALVEFIGSDNIVGHNLEFDLKFILRQGADVTRRKRKYFDTMTLAKRVLKTPKQWNHHTNEYEYNYAEYDVDNFKLATLCEYYHISLLSAHRASGDSYATGILFLELADERTSHPRYYSEEQRQRKMNEAIVEKSPDEIAAETARRRQILADLEAQRQGRTLITAAPKSPPRPEPPPKIKVKLCGKDHLRTLPDNEYYPWAEQFTKWADKLSPATDPAVLSDTQLQLRIINEETSRRAKLQSLKKLTDKAFPLSLALLVLAIIFYFLVKFLA